MIIPCFTYGANGLPANEGYACARVIACLFKLYTLYAKQRWNIQEFLSFSRNYMDEIGSEDSFGRTIWALGYLLRNAPNDAYYQTGREMFFSAAP
jgi:hypothetical protein